jgi:His/Glu/Gln/Arg/opine family amino acid ABC transporter permease subunit
MDLALVLHDVFPLLFRGMIITVETTILSLVIAIVLGLLTCLAGLSHNPALRSIARFYIWVIRGTPL